MQPTISAYAPGRVELLGNHTDYNEGYVLSAAIDRGVLIEGHATGRDFITLKSSTLNLSADVAIKDIAPLENEHSWANYPLGVVFSFIQAGFPMRGLEVNIASNLPLGAGLSSSAALEVGTAMFLKKLLHLQIDSLEMAKLCRRAENEFVGVDCGLLDQVSSIFGKKNHAIFLDCRNETVENMPFPDNVALLITHSGVKHSLVGGEYNERRQQCFDAAKRLGAPALRDVTSSQLMAARDELPELSFKRALHVVGENERVLKGVELLRNGDVTGFGQLMFQSHESSIHNFENSTLALDALVAIAREEPGVFGSRLTGGGFGGATVSLVEKEAADSIAANFESKYRASTGHQCTVYRCEIADGAH